MGCWRRAARHGRQVRSLRQRNVHATVAHSERNHGRRAELSMVKQQHQVESVSWDPSSGVASWIEPFPLTGDGLSLFTMM